jgi:hypothetical protein
MIILAQQPAPPVPPPLALVKTGELALGALANSLIALVPLVSRGPIVKVSTMLPEEEENRKCMYEPLLNSL